MLFRMILATLCLAVSGAVLAQENTELSDIEKIKNCLASENAEWATCFEEKSSDETGKLNGQEFAKQTTDVWVREYYDIKLREGLRLPKSPESSWIRALGIWSPDPYAKAIESYLSGDALRLGARLLAHRIPFDSVATTPSRQYTQ